MFCYKTIGELTEQLEQRRASFCGVPGAANIILRKRFRIRGEESASKRDLEEGSNSL